MAAAADYRITQDHGGFIDDYKLKYETIRDRGQRVIIDGVCNSACTMVLGIVPTSRICVTPRARLGFHMVSYDRAATNGVKIFSQVGTAEIMAYYPASLKEWIAEHGGLTAELKTLTDGPALWAIVPPCPAVIQ